MAPERSAKRSASASDGANKRRRDAPAADSATLRVDNSGVIGPVLVSVSEFAPPSSTEFSLYRAEADGDDAQDGAPATLNDRLLLAGDTPAIQYTSGNWGWGAASDCPVEVRRETRGYTGDYMIGEYDAENNTVTLRKAPLFTMGRSVKALAGLSAMATQTGESAVDYGKARRDLGEAFGNKKQKQAARNMDRMRVKTDNMDGVLSQVATDIDESSANLPSEGELVASLNSSRALPLPNTDATDPAEAYPRESLIPHAVFKNLHVRPLLAAKSQSDLAQSLRVIPASSQWLIPRLWHAVQSAHQDSSANDAVRVGYYIAILLAFRRHARTLSNAQSAADGTAALASKMRLADRERDIVIDDLVSRFSEKTRGTQIPVATPTCDTRVIAHILVLALHLEQFSVAPQPVAQELGVPVQRVNDLFRSLGCSMSTTTQHGADEAGGTTTSKEKLWRLRLPLSFQNLRMRGRGRG